MVNFGPLTEKVIGVNVNQPRWTFQEIKFRLLGLLPRQIFTRPPPPKFIFSVGLRRRTALSHILVVVCYHTVYLSVNYILI